MAGNAPSEREVERALPLVYDELRRLAEGYLRRERAGHTLQPTALVHEAYARLADQTRAAFRDEQHFLATAARVMRAILVDHARARLAGKRGAGAVRVTWRDDAGPGEDGGVGLVELDDALERLAAMDERLARVVELRFFGGLTIEETAAALGVSHMTVSSDWRLARAWLARELEPGA